MLKLTTPEKGAKVTQWTADQKNLLEKYLLSADKVGGYEEADTNCDAELVNDWLKLLMTDGLDFSFPEKILLSWEMTGLEKGKNFFAELSESPFFREKMIFHPGKRGNKIFVHSLKSNTKYFWRITYTAESGRIKHSPASFFYTEEALPRWVGTAGASNIRDIGGKTTLYGKKIRQGLLYRGCALNKSIPVPAASLDFLMENLHLKSDLDTRSNEGESGRVFPRKKVRYFNIPLRAYGNIFSAEQLTNYAKAFRVLTEEKNLPCYTHCLGGADRTGCFIFLVCAVLGMEEKDLLFDYEATSVFSRFRGKRYRSTAYFQSFMQGLKDLAGENAEKMTIQALAENYFLKGGVSKKEMEKLRKNFLED